jgi:beta-glucosidase
MADKRASLMGCWSFNGKADEVETLAEALRRHLPAGCSLVTAAACAIEGGELDLAAVTQAVEGADLVLLALGEKETMSGEAHSRAHLNLPGRQPELVKAVTQLGKPVIALLLCGRPLVIPDLVQSVQALLLAYHGGTRAAQGLCDVLFGRVNPSAKLTASFPRCEGQIPVYYAHKKTGRPIDSEGTIQFNEVHRSAYLDESNDPLFPFGFGLSYTRFAYSDLQISALKIPADGKVTVSAVITNSGATAGSEIVQLYVRDVVGIVTRPVKELKGFQKVALQPGESCRVKFELTPADFTFLDEDLHPIVEPGEMRVWIGPNSSEGLAGQFEIV